MKFYFDLLFIGFLLVVFMLLVFLLTYSSRLFYLVKSSSFECGFYSFGVMGVPFSMSFFVVSLMFLLFDVEIMLVCFFPLFSFFGGWVFFITWFVCLVILLATIYEWVCGVLVWF